MSILQVSDVRKSFGRLQALRGVSFELDTQEVLGIAGPNGAGKSVLFKTLSGTYRPDMGSVQLRGKLITGLGPTKICHLGLTRTFQNPSTFHSLSVRDNIRVGSTFGGSNTRAVGEVIDVLELGPLAHRTATNLDLFTMKRCVLGTALATGCEVLLLDEPMAGFSHDETKRYVSLVRTVADRWGLTILIIEHFLDVLLDMSDRVMVLDQGAPIFLGVPEDVRKDAKVADVYLGKGPSVDQA